MVRAREALLRDDLEGALSWVRQALARDPDDRLALLLHDEVRDLLITQRLQGVGGRHAVLRRKLEGAALLRLNLDHRAGFILSWVDGQTSVDEILDLAGIDSLETLESLSTLLAQGVIVP